MSAPLSEILHDEYNEAGIFMASSPPNISHESGRVRVTRSFIPAPLQSLAAIVLQQAAVAQVDDMATVHVSMSPKGSVRLVDRFALPLQHEQA